MATCHETIEDWKLLRNSNFMVDFSSSVTGRGVGGIERVFFVIVLSLTKDIIPLPNSVATSICMCRVVSQNHVSVLDFCLPEHLCMNESCSYFGLQIDKGCPLLLTS